MKRKVLILACLWITGCSDCTDYIENDPKTTVQDAAFDFGPCVIGCTYSPSCVEPAPEMEPPNVKTEDFLSRVGFLYQGSKARQQCLEEARLDKTFIGVIRGTIQDEKGQGIGGVYVDLPDAAYLGHVYTKIDGSYEMVVNATGKYIVQYRHKDYISATRHVTSRREDFAWVDPTILKKLDKQATVVDFTRPVSMARGSVVEDAAGKRQLTAMFHKGTRVKIIKPDGSEEILDSITFRATEFTVGTTGPDAMPAPLPPSTAYTYAIELSIDEAITAQATEVRFDRPVPLYLENFLEFPVGTIVPAGYYDRQEQRWKASDDGLIIKILGQTDGITAIDLNGDEQPDSDSAIESLGISKAERGRIGRLYEKGQTLWRVPVKHFTPYDFNWGFSAPRPGVDPRINDKNIEEEPCVQSGSIIECENRMLGEMLPLVGTPYQLSYRSDRQGQGSRSIPLQLTQQGDALGDVERIDVIVEIAGQRHVHTIKSPTDDESWTFVWDGLDGFGRPVYGEQQAFVRINYLTWVEYRPTASLINQSFGQPVNSQGTSLNDGLQRGLAAVDYTFTRRLGSFDAKSLYGLGGWMLDVQSSYDRQLQTLYPSDGPPRSRRNVSSIISPAFAFDVFDQTMHLPFEILGADAFDLASGADGWVYMLIAEENQSGMQVVKHLPGTERWEHVAGALSTNATPKHNACTDKGKCGDGGQAVDAIMVKPEPMNVDYAASFEGASLTVSPLDGTVYVTSGRGCIRAVKNAVITTVVGQCGANVVDGEDDDPKTPMYDITSLAAGVDGSLYIGRFGQITQLTPGGRLRQIAGGDQDYFEGIDALSMDVFPSSMAAGLDGRLYFRDLISAYMIDLDNSVRKISRQDELVTDIAVGEDNKVYIGNTRGVYVYENNQFRQYVGGRDFDTLSGEEQTRAREGNNIPALSFVGSTFRLAVGRQGVLWGFFKFPDVENEATLRSVFSPFPNNDGDVYLPDATGQQVSVFDGFGQLQKILNGVDGTTELAFKYDESRRLLSLTNRFGLETSINYGNNEVVVTGPYGHKNKLILNQNEMLDSIVYEDNSTYSFEYNDGLLTKMTKPNGASWAMKYNDEGKLVEDRDPVGGYKRLNQLDPQIVEVTTREGVKSIYNTTIDSNGQKNRQYTMANNTQSSVLKRSNERRDYKTPHGHIVSMDFSPDTRFGFVSPYVSKSTTTLPDGEVLVVEQEKKTNLEQRNDLFSLSLKETIWRKNDQLFFVQRDEIEQRRRTIISAMGRESVINYDENWLPVKIQMPGVLPLVITRNSEGLPIRFEQGQHVVVYEYNNGLLSQVTDGVGSEKGVKYDQLLRPTTYSRKDQTKLHVSYDELGYPQSIEVPSQKIHQLKYDSRSLPIFYQFPNGEKINQSFDFDGRLIKTSNAQGKEVVVKYNEKNQPIKISSDDDSIELNYVLNTGLVSEVSTSDQQLKFSYNGGLVKKIETSGQIDSSLEMKYNSRFLLKSLKINNEHEIKYNYDLDELPIQIGPLKLTYFSEQPWLKTTQLGKTRSTQTYNEYGQYDTYEVDYDGANVFEMSLSYDKLGRVVKVVEEVDKKINKLRFNYDVMSRLVDVYRNDVLWQKYTYDVQGNRLTFASNHQNENGQFDDSDSIVSYANRIYSHNGNGHVSQWREGDKITKLSYGVFNQLMKVSLPGGKVIDYNVDAMGRRTTISVDGMLTHKLVYKDYINPVALLDQSDKITARFVYGKRHVHVPEFMFKGSVLYRLVSDYLGSIRLVVNVETGHIEQRLDYDPFGRVISDTNPGFQPFGFAGGLYDHHTKLVHFGVRDYDSFTGRWLSRDPVGFEGGDVNFYTYVGNRPTTHIDPTGLWAWLIPPVVGGIMGAVANYTGGAANPKESSLTSSKRVMIGFTGGAIGGFAAMANPALGGALAFSSTYGMNVAAGIQPPPYSASDFGIFGLQMAASCIAPAVGGKSAKNFVLNRQNASYLRDESKVIMATGAVFAESTVNIWANNITAWFSH